MGHHMDPNANASPYVVTDKRARNGASPAAKAEPDAKFSIEEQERLLAAQAASDDSEDPRLVQLKPVMTAFIVIIDYDGAVTAASALDHLDAVAVGRPANFADMFAAAAHIQKDIASQEVAQRTVNSLQMQAAQAQQSIQAQQVQQSMRGVPRGYRS